MEKQTPIQELAMEARSFFERIPETESYRVKEGAPHWVQDMVFAAHGNGNLLPDDFTYSTVVEVLEKLAEGNDPDDLTMEADYATHELIEWMKSHGERFARVDEAIRELRPDGLFDAMQIAQEDEKNEIAHAVVSALQEQLDGNACEHCNEYIAWHEHTTAEGVTVSVCDHCLDELDEG